MKRSKYIMAIIILSISLAGCRDDSKTSQDFNLRNGSDVNLEKTNPSYQDVINDYGKLVEFRLSPSFEDDYNSGQFVTLSGEWADGIWNKKDSGEQVKELRYRFHCMLVDMLDDIQNPTIASFGYFLMDLSEDQIPELVWVRDDYRILAIFQICDTKVQLIDAFWPKYKCSFLDTGELYTLAIGGADDYVYTIARIDNATASLKNRREFGKENGVYYEKIDSFNHIISEEEFEKIYTNNLFHISNIGDKGTVLLSPPETTEKTGDGSLS